MTDERKLLEECKAHMLRGDRSIHWELLQRIDAYLASPATDLAAFRERCAEIAEQDWRSYADTKAAHERMTDIPFAASQFGISMAEVRRSKEIADRIRALPLDDGEGVKTTYTILDAAISLLDAHDCKAAVRSIEAAKKYIPNVPVVNS